MSESKRTLLIVDDDPSILRVLKRILEKKGYFVTTVENGKAALFQIAHNRFWASIVDVRLPDMNGFEIAKKIQETSPQTVRIVFTGSPDAFDCVNSKRKDLDAFLTKPVKPEELLSILDEKLQSRFK